MREDGTGDLGRSQISFIPSLPEQVARLYVEHGVLKFSGDMDAAATKLFDSYLRPMCDHYIRERLKSIAGGG